jgi:hypothetical protein
MGERAAERLHYGDLLDSEAPGELLHESVLGDGGNQVKGHVFSLRTLMP